MQHHSDFLVLRCRCSREETWEGTYGVKKSGNRLDLGFVAQGPYSVNVGSRGYVMENEEYKA